MNLSKAPPASNTGAQPPAHGHRAPMGRYLFDWLSFTYPARLTLSDVFESLHIHPDKFTKMPQGLNGYQTQYRFGDVKVLTDGTDNMGHHVILSGQGVRQFESRWTWTDFEPEQAWQQQIYRWVMEGVRFTRIDVARDVYGFRLTEAVLRGVSIGSAVTRFRDYKTMLSGQIQGSPGGLTLYLGNATSKMKIRIYDKAAQMGLQNIWHRFEIELKKERAEAFAMQFGKHGNLGRMWTRVINQYFSIRTVQPETENRSKWPIAPWWASFMSSSERTKLTFAKPDKTLDETEAWFRRQMAPTLATVFEHRGGDMDYLKDLLIEGYVRRSARHAALLKGEK